MPTGHWLNKPGLVHPAQKPPAPSHPKLAQSTLKPSSPPVPKMGNPKFKRPASTNVSVK